MSEITITSPGIIYLQNGAENYGTINGTVEIETNAVNAGTINGNVTVTTGGVLGGTVVGNATVTNGSVAPSLTITGDLTMSGTSSGGNATVTGNVTLNNTATLAPTTITGSVTLNDTSVMNTATITGSVTINGGALNGGTVSETITVNYGTNAATAVKDIFVFSGENSGSTAGSIYVYAGASNTGTSTGSGSVQENIASGSPVVTTHPTATTASAGGATFTVVATDAVDYQWQVKGTSDTEFSDILNATSSTLTLTGLGAGDDGKKYRCKVSNVTGTVYSNFGLLASGAGVKDGAYSDGYYNNDVKDETYSNAIPQLAQDDSLWYTYAVGVPDLASGAYSNYSFVAGETQTSYTTVAGARELCYPLPALDDSATYYEYNAGVASLASGLYTDAYYDSGTVASTGYDSFTPLKSKWVGSDGLGEDYRTVSGGIASAVNGAYTNGHFTYSAPDDYTNLHPAGPDRALDTGEGTGNPLRYFHYNGGAPVAMTPGAYSIGYLDADGYIDATIDNNIPGDLPAVDDMAHAYVYSAGVAARANDLYKSGKFVDGTLDASYGSQDGIPESSVNYPDFYQIYSGGYPLGGGLGASGKYPNGKFTSGAIDSAYNSVDSLGGSTYLPTPEITELGSALYGYFIYANGVASNPTAGAYTIGNLLDGGTYGGLLSPGNASYHQALDTAALWYEYGQDGTAAVGPVSGHYSFGYLSYGALSGLGTPGMYQAADDLSYYFYDQGGNATPATGYFSTGYYANGSLATGAAEYHLAEDDQLMHQYDSTSGAALGTFGGYLSTGYYSNGALTGGGACGQAADDANYYYYDYNTGAAQPAPAHGTPTGTTYDVTETSSGFNYVVGHYDVLNDGGCGAYNGDTYYVPSGTSVGVGNGGTFSEVPTSETTTTNIPFNSSWLSDGAGGAYEQWDCPSGVLSSYNATLLTTPAGEVTYSVTITGDGGYSTNATGPCSYTTTSTYPTVGDILNSETKYINVSETGESVPYTVDYVYTGGSSYDTVNNYPANGAVISTGTSSANGGRTITNIAGIAGNDYNYNVTYTSTGDGGYTSDVVHPGNTVVLYTGTDSTNGGYTINTPVGDFSYTQDYVGTGDGGWIQGGTDGRPSVGTPLGSGSGTITITETSENVTYPIDYVYNSAGGYDTVNNYPANGDEIGSRSTSTTSKITLPTGATPSEDYYLQEKYVSNGSGGYTVEAIAPDTNTVLGELAGVSYPTSAPGCATAGEPITYTQKFYGDGTTSGYGTTDDWTSVSGTILGTYAGYHSTSDDTSECASDSVAIDRMWGYLIRGSSFEVDGNGGVNKVAAEWGTYTATIQVYCGLCVGGEFDGNVGVDVLVEKAPSGGAMYTPAPGVGQRLCSGSIEYSFVSQYAGHEVLDVTTSGIPYTCVLTATGNAYDFSSDIVYDIPAANTVLATFTDGDIPYNIISTGELPAPTSGITGWTTVNA